MMITMNNSTDKCEIWLRSVIHLSINSESDIVHQLSIMNRFMMQNFEGKAVNPTRRPLFTPQEDSWYSFLLVAESIPGPQCGWKY
jgi:hypothetical protein